MIGVSPDGAESHLKFKAKHRLPMTLLADEDRAVAKSYGVWVEKNTFGLKRMGIARTTFVISPDGKIDHVFEKVDPSGHAEEVAELLAERQAHEHRKK